MNGAQAAVDDDGAALPEGLSNVVVTLRATHISLTRSSLCACTAVVRLYPLWKIVAVHSRYRMVTAARGRPRPASVRYYRGVTHHRDHYSRPEETPWTRPRVPMPA